MKQRKLDRITIAEFLQSPIHLRLAVPLTVPKNKVLETAMKYLRKKNIETKQKKGYFKILNRKVCKTNFNSYELTSHPDIRVDYSYRKWTYYRCWSVKIDFIYSNEIPTRYKNKIKNGGRKWRKN